MSENDVDYISYVVDMAKMQEKVDRLESALAAEKANMAELRARLHQLAPYDRDAALDAIDRLAPADCVRVHVSECEARFIHAYISCADMKSKLKTGEYYLVRAKGVE